MMTDDEAILERFQDECDELHDGPITILRDGLIIVSMNTFVIRETKETLHIVLIRTRISEFYKSLSDLNDINRCPNTQFAHEDYENSIEVGFDNLDEAMKYYCESIGLKT